MHFFPPVIAVFSLHDVCTLTLAQFQLFLKSERTDTNGNIAQNMIAALAIHFGEGPCRAFSSDVRVRVAEKKYYLPDVVVSCNSEDSQRGVDIIHFPRFVMEVLSPSTEVRDRGKKLVAYQTCPTIQEYVLTASELQRVEIFRRYGNGNLWNLPTIWAWTRRYLYKH